MWNLQINESSENPGGSSLNLRLSSNFTLNHFEQTPIVPPKGPLPPITLFCFLTKEKVYNLLKTITPQPANNYPHPYKVSQALIFYPLIC